ncbi:hypothetical protein A2801_01955 [Candidatus Woesebacteria bacterium RIFCSPHIGHO2_01_FULL_41_10]|uniref:PDZ domain-containing protein n=1 Tax=Candidatus Woesebacteria bacterium RIFCSPHIGHO2_01_FULL_41_10 TaxID=1802500 RepID=A0A1F7YQ86_9BACT|nr:MAG: hypothetical protein A2801_01955 [Candidatus Woesebacteria bacterium RIFCSPHIGHO2_01_FULL_41_10]
MNKTKAFLAGVAVTLILIASVLGGAIADRLLNLSLLDRLIPRGTSSAQNGQIIFNEESSVISVAEKVSPSVVTITVETPQRRVLNFNPFGGGFESRIEGGEDQDIGSGFIVDASGLVVTNRHVVDQEDVTYKVITNNDKEYEVQKITRDPSNDLAILQIDAEDLPAIELGDSDNLKVGQFVVAIGTALGEFRHTVTTGVISGLGRGITAGSPFQGFVERLDNVIQTDAAINPGNSGGPLLNSAGQVIGVNTAVSQDAENIGFALPINTVKEGLAQFNETGSFASKAFLGVGYQMISRQAAILNDVPQGAYVQTIEPGYAAERAGIQVDDIITKIDGQNVAEYEDGLAGILLQYKPGDTLSIEIWRNGEIQTLTTTLTDASS